MTINYMREKVAEAWGKNEVDIIDVEFNPKKSSQIGFSAEARWLRTPFGPFCELEIEISDDPIYGPHLYVKGKLDLMDVAPFGLTELLTPPTV
jgi:hypothetical protein